VSSSPISLSSAASPLVDIITPSRHVTLLSHGAKMNSLHSLYLLTTLRPVASPTRSEIEVLNLHHHRWPPSLNSPTPTHHCYKKIISILINFPTTQPRLYFASSLTKAPRHQSSTHHKRSLSPSFYVHRPSTQWNIRWWTSRPFFTYRIGYHHVNSRKNIKLVINYLWIIFLSWQCYSNNIYTINVYT
jgi:hypothetical protein